jgi:hypothetical protein
METRESVIEKLSPFMKFEQQTEDYGQRYAIVDVAVIGKLEITIDSYEVIVSAQLDGEQSLFGMFYLDDLVIEKSSHKVWLTCDGAAFRIVG